MLQPNVLYLLELERLAHTDSLTGLDNRLAFMRKLGLDPDKRNAVPTAAFERFAREGLKITVQHLAELPAGVWSGPISSRHGIHLVFVHERQPGTVPQLEAAREQVLALWHEIAAERWLDERLHGLRGDYEIVLEREARV